MTIFQYYIRNIAYFSNVTAFAAANKELIALANKLNSNKTLTTAAATASIVMNKAELKKKNKFRL